MPDWEYLLIRCLFANGAWRPVNVGGKELENWEEQPPVLEYCDRLRREGWVRVEFSLTRATLWGYERGCRVVLRRRRAAHREPADGGGTSSGH